MHSGRVVVRKDDHGSGEVERHASEVLVAYVVVLHRVSQVDESVHELVPCRRRDLVELVKVEDGVHDFALDETLR